MKAGSKLLILFLSQVAPGPGLAGCASDATPPVESNAWDAGIDRSPPDDGGSPDDGASPDALTSQDTGAEATPDASLDSGVSCDEKAKDCASEFGTLFTKANGRADGTLLAVVRPQDQQCRANNDDHVVLQVSILGQVQRLVVAVDGVAVATASAPLMGDPYEEGWHTNGNLDYPSDLGVHSTDFTSVSMAQAVDFLCGALTPGEPVSVYAYCDGPYPDSAHQVHYNEKYPDGAVVVAPTSSTPTYLLFRYENQEF